jgi:hypothetical protein
MTKTKTKPTKWTLLIGHGKVRVKQEDHTNRGFADRPKKEKRGRN